MYTDKCTLYASFYTTSDIVRHVDISVSGRKSLCLAAASELIRFADDHYPRRPISFELHFGANATWVTEAHYFQVWPSNSVSASLLLSSTEQYL